MEKIKRFWRYLTTSDVDNHLDLDNYCKKAKIEADLEEKSFKENMEWYKRFALIKCDRYTFYSIVSILDKSSWIYYKDITPSEATKIMFELSYNNR